MLIKLVQLLCIIQYTAYGYLYYKSRSEKSTKCKADEQEPWSYRGKNGPRYWGELFPTCNGEEQSPIAIMSVHAVPDDKLDKLFFYNYDKLVTRATMRNTGSTIEVSPTDGVERSIYVNGESYSLQQLHFHWGESASKGSEHTLNGMYYSMEMHLVHQNARGQTAVVAVLFQEQRKSLPELKTLTVQFPEVLYKDMDTELRYKLDLNRLLPANPASFYRYQGSLTTPTCDEGVAWSVLTKPLPVGKKQMSEFRTLYSAKKSEATKKCKLSGNYRPLQLFNYRKVYVSL